MNETYYTKFHKYAVGLHRPEDISTHDMKRARNLECLEVSRNGIMKCILIRLGRRGLCLFVSGNTSVTDCCEYSTEPLVFTKYFYA